MDTHTCTYKMVQRYILQIVDKHTPVLRDQHHKRLKTPHLLEGVW